MTFTVLTLAVLCAAPSAKAAEKPGRHAPHSRQLEMRAVTITDATTAVEIHVAAGAPTTLMFPIRIAKHLLIDAKGYFSPSMQQKAERLFVLLPDKDIGEGEAVSLQITLEDGTLLPPIVLLSVPDKFDSNVEVKVDLRQKAAAESVAALKAQVVELRSRLDDCHQGAGEAGAGKIAELVLKQDFGAPAAFVAEHHSARKIDRQEALLVETRVVYRLFDLSYLVLTVENRDPDKSWVLDKAEISIAGGSSTTDAQVVRVVREVDELPAGQEARYVVVFKTPEQEVAHRFTLRLREKGGNRHVELEGIKL